MKHVLVHADSSARCAARIDTAAAIAHRFEARLVGLFAEAEIIGGSLVGRRSRERFLQAARDAEVTFRERARVAGVDVDWWQLDPGEHRHLLDLTAACCRYVDLAVFGQPEPSDTRVPEDLVQQVVQGAGRPVLVVPSSGEVRAIGRRVVIAWSASRESARAVNDALPLISGAEQVAVLALRRPDSGAAPGTMPDLDITAHLALHGLPVHYERVIQDDFTLLDTVLNRCFELSADLLVMGAYASRRTSRLGRDDTIRRLLGSMTTPLLLSA